MNQLQRILEFVIRADATGAIAQVNALNGALGGGFAKSATAAANSANHASSATDRMRVSTDGLRRIVGRIRNEILVYSFALGGLFAVLNQSVKAHLEASSAMTGLEAVARKTVGEVDQVKLAAQSLASDGLMTVGDAATALKNLLTTGFGLDQAVNIINAYRDSAAFGRQASLGFGESIRGATEGIKNGNCESYNDVLFVSQEYLAELNDERMFQNVIDVGGKNYCQLKIGDLYSSKSFPVILSYDRKQNKLVERQVYGIAKNGRRKTLKITFSNGSQVECTPNHRFFLVDGEYVYAKDLRKDLEVLCLSSEFVKSVEKDSLLMNVESAEKHAQENAREFCRQGGIALNSNASNAVKFAFSKSLKQNQKLYAPLNAEQNGGHDSKQTKNVKYAGKKSRICRHQSPKYKDFAAKIALLNGDQPFSSEKIIRCGEAEYLQLDRMAQHQKNTGCFLSGNEQSGEETGKSAKNAERQKGFNLITLSRGIYIQNLDSIPTTDKFFAENTTSSQRSNFLKQHQEKRLLADCEMPQREMAENCRTDILCISNLSKKNLIRQQNLLAEYQPHQTSEESIHHCIDTPCNITEQWPMFTQGMDGRSMQSEELHYLIGDHDYDESLKNLLDAGFTESESIDLIARLYDLAENNELHLHRRKSEDFFNGDGVSFSTVNNSVLDILQWNQYIRTDIPRDNNFGEYVNAGISTCLVINVEDAGYQDVFDVEVCVDHCFMTTGCLLTSNSILSDNAGLTKNLSRILVEASLKEQDLMRTQEDANVRLALYNGILKEAAVFQGNAALLTGTLSGQMAKLSTEVFKTKDAIGAAFGIVLKNVSASLSDVIRDIREFFVANKEVLALRLEDAYQKIANVFKFFGEMIYETITGFGLFKGALSSTAPALAEVSKLADALSSVLAFLITKKILALVVEGISALMLALKTGAGWIGIVITALSALAGFIIPKLSEWFDTAATSENLLTKEMKLANAAAVDQKNKVLALQNEQMTLLQVRLNSIEALKTEKKLTKEQTTEVDNLRKSIALLATQSKETQKSILSIQLGQLGGELSGTRFGEAMSLKGLIPPDLANATKKEIDSLVEYTSRRLAVAQAELICSTEGLLTAEKSQFAKGIELYKQRKEAYEGLTVKLNEFITLLIQLGNLQQKESPIIKTTIPKGLSEKEIDKLASSLNKFFDESELDMIEQEFGKFNRQRAETINSFGEINDVINKLSKNKFNFEKELGISESGLRRMLDFATDTKMAGIAIEEAREQTKELKKAIDDLESAVGRSERKTTKLGGILGIGGEFEDTTIFNLRNTITQAQELLGQFSEEQLRLAGISIEKLKTLIKEGNDAIAAMIEEQTKNIAMKQFSQIDQLIGGFQNLGKTLLQPTILKQEASRQVDELKKALQRGEISQAEFAARIKNIHQNLSKQVHNVWRTFAGNFISQFTTILQEMVVKSLAVKSILGAALAGGAIGIVGGLLAGLVGNQEAEISMDYTESQASERERRSRYGSIASAVQMSVAITPTVHIDSSGGNIFISGGTIEGFETGLENMIKEVTKQALETGELVISPSLGRDLS